MTVITSANKFCRHLLKVIALVLVVSSLFGSVNYAEVHAVDVGGIEFAGEKTTAPKETTTLTEESTVAETSSEPVNDEAYKELQSQYDAIEIEMSQNQQKLDEVKKDMNVQEQVVDGLGSKIDKTQNEVNLLLTRQQILSSEINNTEKQIGVINAQLGSLSEQITATEDAIAQKNVELDNTYELLKRRIRAMYMAGNGSNLEFLLTSADFSTLLIRTELLVRAAQHDNDLMDMLESDIEILESLNEDLKGDVVAEENKKNELNNKTQTLQSSKAEVQKTSNKLKEKQNQLEKEMNAAEAELKSLDKESDEYKALISKQEDELIALSKQMEEFIRLNGSSTSDKPPTYEKGESSDDSDGNKGNSGSKDEYSPYLDGTETVFSSGMIFPLKCSGVYISSPYGMRTHPTTGEYKLHTGTDFCAPNINGKTVYAAKGGEVIYAAKHKAYGNFVIIDHGAGVSTCYAHMQDGSLLVSVGQKVSQGQPIGKVGTTGYSTGPHLHFEVRIDGATTNPMGGYVKLPG